MKKMAFFAAVITFFCGSFSLTFSQDMQKIFRRGNMTIQVGLYGGQEKIDVGIEIKTRYETSDRDDWEIQFVVTEPGGGKGYEWKIKWEPGGIDDYKWLRLGNQTFPVKARNGIGMLKIFIGGVETARFPFYIDNNGYIEWRSTIPRR